MLSCVAMCCHVLPCIHIMSATLESHPQLPTLHVEPKHIPLQYFTHIWKAFHHTHRFHACLPYCDKQDPEYNIRVKVIACFSSPLDLCWRPPLCSSAAQALQEEEEEEEGDLCRQGEGEGGTRSKWNITNNRGICTSQTHELQEYNGTKYSYTSHWQRLLHGCRNLALCFKYWLVSDKFSMFPHSHKGFCSVQWNILRQIQITLWIRIMRTLFGVPTT